jgi:NADH:ubiquinone oxidoreductase subunit 3 (subunit A)
LTDLTDSLLGPLIIVVVDLIAFLLVGRLGRRTKGRGIKYEPFSGGEPAVPSRGLYQSSLFIFAALFLVVETFALILGGSFEAPSSYYPFLFLIGGGSVVIFSVMWFLTVGGGKF